MTTTFDADRYKQQTRRDWDLAADAWRDAMDILEAGGREVSRTLVELAQVGPGDRVLDVAAGYGEPALTAARAVGADGEVVATDLSAGMLEIARERAGHAGLDNVELVEGDVETLELDEAAFDAVLCRQGLQFLTDLSGTLQRLHRALTPGGRLAAATWSGPSEVDFARPVGAIAETLEWSLPPPGRPGLFALSDPAGLEDHLREAGFDDVRSGTVDWPIEVDSAETWIEIVRGTARAITSRIDDHPPPDRERAWSAAVAALRPLERDGRLRLDNRAIWVVGTR